MSADQGRFGDWHFDNSSLLTVRWILQMVQCTLQIVHWTLKKEVCRTLTTRKKSHFTLYTNHWTVSPSHWIIKALGTRWPSWQREGWCLTSWVYVDTLHFSKPGSQLTVYIVLYLGHSGHCTLFYTRVSVDSVHCSIPGSQWTVFSVLYLGHRNPLW